MKTQQTQLAITVAVALVSGFLDSYSRAYSLDWFSVDGGGGPAVGGGYEVSVTIGQFDAGAAAGGAYVLQTGFWPGPWEESASPVPPVLSATRFGTEMVLSWPAAAGEVVLEQTNLLGDPTRWRSVSAQPTPVGNELQVVLHRESVTAFFRLRLDR